MRHKTLKQLHEQFESAASRFTSYPQMNQGCMYPPHDKFERLYTAYLNEVKKRFNIDFAKLDFQQIEKL